MHLSMRFGAFLALNLSLLPSVTASSTCSQLAGSIYTGPNDSKFDILCDTAAINGNIFAYYSEGDEFQDCVDRCDAENVCVVALYFAGSSDCALINSYQGTAAFNGNDIAIKRPAETSTSAAPETTTTEVTTSEAATTSDVATTHEAAATTETTSTEAVSSEATSSTSIETSTDDCDDETSSLETSATVTTSTVTGSQVQPTTSSTDSQGSSSTSNQSSEVSTSAPSATSTISSTSSLATTKSETSLSTSLPSSVTSQAGSSLPVSSGTTVTQTYTQTYATYSQGASSSGSSNSGTTKVGSKTLSTSGVTVIKTTSGGHKPTTYPTTYNVWTVCLTITEHVTCSTGVVTEAATTTTYVTVGSNGGSYGPPVITTPAGCIGGYQVDANGHSYPVTQPTKGTYGNSPSGEYSQPSVRPTPGSPANPQSGYETAKVHNPAPAAESHGSSQPGQGDKQHSVPGQGSSEHNNGKPQSTQGGATETAISGYYPGASVNPSPSSAIHQGQQGISTIFTIKASVTEEMQAPKSTHSGSSEAGEAPYTPVSVSGANRHQFMAWTLAAGAILGFAMLT
nr:hypothetical protein FVER53263_03624 [Fusarium verticillioides]